MYTRLQLLPRDGAAIEKFNQNKLFYLCFNLVTIGEKFWENYMLN